MTVGKVTIGADFLLVISLAIYLDSEGVVPQALLACGLHELGHIVMLGCLGGTMSRLHLGWVGAEMEVVGRLNDCDELLLALAGPMTNLMIAVVLGQWGNVPLFCGLNLALGLLNLVPVGALDGGRALYALCAMFWGDEVAESVQWWLNQGMSFLLLGVGIAVLIFGGSFTLLLLAIWVRWTGKTQKISKITLAKKTTI